MLLFDMLLISLIVIAIFLTVAIFYLLTLQNTLKEVSPENRLIPDSNVWLMLIPLFNIFYAFYFYPKLCDSIKNELEARDFGEKGDYGKTLGLVLAALGIIGFIPELPAIISFGNLVVFILFWVKINGYKTKLINSPKSFDLIGKEVD